MIAYQIVMAGALFGVGVLFGVLAKRAHRDVLEDTFHRWVMVFGLVFVGAMAIFAGGLVVDGIFR